MHIKSAILLGPASPYRGGIAMFTESLARAFTKHGVRSRIYTFTLQYPSFLFPGKSQYSDSPAPTDLDIVRAMNSVNPFNWIKTGRRIARERPDVVVVKYWLPFMAPCLGTICRLARKNGHTKVIAHLDNIVPHEERFFDRLFTRYFVNSVDAFVYMSAQVKADLDTFTNDKPSVFSPHPLYDIYGDSVTREEACEHLKLDPEYDYSLFFGFVRDYKGLDILIDAFGIMKRRGTLGKRRLIVAGEYYADKNKYTELIRANDLENEVILFDYFIGDDDVRYFFCAADIVVQPYKTATQSGVTQIAYHFNVPMIVTDVGGLAEIVTDGVVGYVTDTAPESIASAVEKFYDQNKAPEFRANMDAEKKRFSWDATVEKIDELYTQIKI